jgi:hypothetical protein
VEEAEEAEMGEAWQRVTKKSKSKMSFEELHSYYESKLRQVGKCPNKKCDCLAILSDMGVRAPVVKYLCWFNGETKYKQDTLVLGWFKYTSMKRTKINWFCLPYIDDGTNIPEAVRKHMLCSRGLRILLYYGQRRFRSIRTATTTTGVLPVHKATGKPAPNAITQHKIEPLMTHLQYLTNLGEVRATRVVSHMVEGMEERTNRDVDDDVIYLPRYMTFRSCYKWYMNMLGYNARTTGSGVTIIEHDDGKDIDADDFVSFPTYFYTWKSKFPKLKVSKPAEDICQYCYAFAHRHKYLANRSLREGGDSDDGDDNGGDDLATGDGNEEEGAEEETTIDGERCATPIRGVNLNTPEASCTVVEERGN